MSEPVSFLVQSCAVPNRRIKSLQLAGAIHVRRIHLKMSIDQAAKFSGLKREQWANLESGWLPPMDDPQGMWIWWTLSSSLQMKAHRLLCLASVDLARQLILAKQKVAA